MIYLGLRKRKDLCDEFYPVLASELYFDTYDDECSILTLVYDFDNAPQKAKIGATTYYKIFKGLK